MKKRNDPLRIDNHLVDALAVLADQPKVQKVIKYLTPELTVKVTRQRRTRANARQRTFLLSVGTPNFLERRVIKSALKAGSKFPLPVVQQ